MAHLQEMDYLKASIGLRAYGQRDPLTEYRDEAHRAFAALTSSIYEDYLRFLLRAPIVVQVAPQEESSPLDGKVSYSNPEQTLNEGSGVRRGAPQGGPSRLLLRRSLKLKSLIPTKRTKTTLTQMLVETILAHVVLARNTRNATAQITELMGDSASFPLCGFKPHSMPLL